MWGMEAPRGGAAPLAPGMESGASKRLQVPRLAIQALPWPPGSSSASDLVPAPTKQTDPTVTYFLTPFSIYSLR